MIQCERCRRHRFEADLVCPFCTDTPSLSRPRLAVVAAGLAAALAGCSTPPPAPVYGGPPEPAAPPPVMAPSDAAPETKAAPESKASPSSKARPEVIKPVYGIPPVNQFAPPPPSDAAPESKAAPESEAPANQQTAPVIRPINGSIYGGPPADIDQPKTPPKATP